MIIQNLHKNIIRNKNQESREETHRVILIRFVLSLFFSLYSFFSYSQDSVPAKVPVSEKINFEFQEVFFKALSEKAIKNYQNAINYLEQANSKIPNNKAVLFELSKNYFLLNKNFEAIEYGKSALKEEPNNLWILEHLVKIYKKERDYKPAIKLQKKIIKNHPKKKQDLVYLYLQNSNLAEVKKTLLELKEEKLLNARLRRILAKFELRANIDPPKKLTNENAKNTNLEEAFKSDKSYSTLKKLLEKLDLEKSNKLESYSQQGMELFPAQPYVYLMNGKSLNTKKQYKKALESLQNGIDFVIDDKMTTKKLYVEIANAYFGLGNVKEANKYTKKALKLK